MIPIISENAPSPSGPYSQAVVCGRMVFVSGQIPVDPRTLAVPDGIEEQIRTAIKNLHSVLCSANFKNILSVTVYLTDMNDLQIMNSIYSEMFGAPYPARTCIEVCSLPKGVKIMIDAIGEI